MIELKIDVGSANTIKMDVETPEVLIENGDIGYHGDPSGTSDYNELANKPYLNDVLIQGRMYETDPTVPSWAKESKKPAYNAQEVNAVGVDDVVSYRDIDNILNMLWD